MPSLATEFTFRIRFIMPTSSNNIASDDEVWILADGPNRVELRSRGEGQSLRDAEHLVIIGRNYPSQSTAEQAGLRWSSIAKAAFAAQHLQADFGRLAPKGFATNIALRRIYDSTGETALNDIHGVMTYPSEPRPVLIGFGPVNAIRGVNGPRLRATLLEAARLNVDLDESKHLAYDIFSAAALAYKSVDARFMLHMMALETLIVQESRPDDSLRHIAKLRTDTSTASLPDHERQSIDNALETLTRESVGRAGRRLARTLGDRKYHDMSPVSFFNTCYEARSRLVHGHLARPGRNEVAAFGASLEVFVADLIAGQLVGFGHDDFL
jgi:hypothetical protein